jgi:ATP-dependent RNA helicase DHX29
LYIWLTVSQDSPNESPLPSGTNTPRRVEPKTRHAGNNDANIDRNVTSVSDRERLPSKSTPVKATSSSKYDTDSDIDPDELLPIYLKTKAQLFHLQPSKQPALHSSGQKKRDRQAALKEKTEKLPTDPEVSKLQRKLDRIEGDILFDKYIANQQWEQQRIQLERDAATQRNAVSGEAPERIPHPAEVLEDSDTDEVGKEAARIGAEILESNDSDDDAAVADLFASLPVTEVDPVTGKSNVVVNNSDGTKVTIRDFGTTIGMIPRRVLEEACKAR